jgi:hypothetical protein
MARRTPRARGGDKERGAKGGAAPAARAPRPPSEWDRRAREGRERQEAERQRRATRPESEWDRRARAARRAADKRREEERKKRERERKRLARLRGPFNRAARQREAQKQREREARERKKEEREAEEAEAARPPKLPQLPRRSKKRPKVFRDEGGRFAPADRRGSDEAGWVPVWSAGWQRADGSTAASYSSLRELPDWERYYERLVVAGGGEREYVDPSREEWKRVAREIAAEIGVHVQEVYTLGLSP